MPTVAGTAAEAGADTEAGAESRAGAEDCEGNRTAAVRAVPVTGAASTACASEAGVVDAQVTSGARVRGPFASPVAGSGAVTPVLMTPTVVRVAPEGPVGTGGVRLEPESPAREPVVPGSVAPADSDVLLVAPPTAVAASVLVLWAETDALSCGTAVSVAMASAGGRCRQDGEEPCASAWMRCFIVGGRERVCGWTRMGPSSSVAFCGAPVLRAVSVSGTAATAVVVMSPSDVHSVMNAVMTAVHSLMTLFLVMSPHFRVG